MKWRARSTYSAFSPARRKSPPSNSDSAGFPPKFQAAIGKAHRGDQRAVSRTLIKPPTDSPMVGTSPLVMVAKAVTTISALSRRPRWNGVRFGRRLHPLPVAVRIRAGRRCILGLWWLSRSSRASSSRNGLFF